MDFLEATPDFIHFQQMYRSLSSQRESIGALLFVHCREEVPISENPLQRLNSNKLFTNSEDTINLCSAIYMLLNGFWRFPHR